MSLLAPLFVEIAALCAAGQRVREELLRLTIEGDAFSEDIANQIRKLNSSLSALGGLSSSAFVDGNQVDDDLLEYPNQLIGKTWRWVIGKGRLAALLQPPGTEKTFVFLNEERFIVWLEGIDPLVAPIDPNDPFSGPTVIRVYGLSRGLWGPQLKILGLDDMLPGQPSSRLPDDQAVNSNVRIVSEANVKLRPRAWEITDGDSQSKTAMTVRQKSARVMAACLLQQITETPSGFIATFRGGRRVDLPFVSTLSDYLLLAKLNEALTWVYAERTETRLKLLAEALCTELGEEQSLMDGLRKFLSDALVQAQDSYGFVILERKDAFHKEMRDFMKDMKTQADQYASKVRDLIAALARDVVGVLVLVGFSFIGKFDVTNLQQLVTSAPFAILCKALAVYLIVSSALLATATIRDANLGLEEINGWFKILQNYVSSPDFAERVLGPLQKRRTFLWIMLGIVGILYVAVIRLVWQLPYVIPAYFGWK
jgi:hypothetical protein